MKTYELEVDGFWTDITKTKMDNDKGIYFVFRATGDVANGYELAELLYVGKSKDVNDRLNGYHHKHQSVMARCKKLGGFPAYYIGVIRVARNTSVSADDLTRVESAIIFDRNPILNDTADKKFHHSETIVNMFGRPTEKGDSGIPAGFGRPTIHIQKDEEKQQVS